MLSNETVSDKYPIPHSQNLFRSLEGAKYFSTVDMDQIPTKKRGPRQDRFYHRFRTFWYLKIRDLFFRELLITDSAIIYSLYRTMIAYLDNICYFGNNFEKF